MRAEGQRENAVEGHAVNGSASGFPTDHTNPSRIQQRKNITSPTGETGIRFVIVIASIIGDAFGQFALVLFIELQLIEPPIEAMLG